jgi:cytochrome c-type biogenesis protein CcmE
MSLLPANSARRKRLALVLFLVFGVGTAVILAMKALQQNINVYYSPSEVAAGKAPRDRTFRLGGMVVPGSVKRSADGVTVQFDVTDTAKKATIRYKGILPDLFREGQGIMAQGRFNKKGIFVATEVLAKHDEKYVPPEVERAIRKAKGQQPAGNK